MVFFKGKFPSDKCTWKENSKKKMEVIIFCQFNAEAYSEFSQSSKVELFA